VDTTKHLTETLADSLRQANEFVVAMKSVQNEVVRELETQIESSKTLFRQMIAKIQVGLRDLLLSIGTETEEASSKLNKVNLASSSTVALHV
jgi:hypothetical protein